MTNNQDALSMWVIYENPADYPGQFVVRRWEILAGKSEPKEVVAVERSLYEARMKGVPRWAHCLGRMPEDEICIVETWV